VYENKLYRHIVTDINVAFLQNSRAICTKSAVSEALKRHRVAFCRQIAACRAAPRRALPEGRRWVAFPTGDGRNLFDLSPVGSESVPHGRRTLVRGGAVPRRGMASLAMRRRRPPATGQSRRGRDARASTPESAHDQFRRADNLRSVHSSRIVHGPGEEPRTIERQVRATRRVPSDRKDEPKSPNGGDWKYNVRWLGRRNSNPTNQHKGIARGLLASPPKRAIGECG
jgi:hypothetical protein